MSFNQAFEINEFGHGASELLISSIYEINQSNTPEVGGLSSSKSMKNLIEMATKNLVIKNGKEIIGFIVCFRENSKYKSPNYKHISSLDNKFLYIDRVAIKKSFTRSGIGTAVYKTLFDHADREKLPIYCEVNIEPINMPSLDFHKKNGFLKIGEKQFEDHSVAYFRR